VWREKHDSDIGMKITNKKRMSGSMIKNKQNFETYVVHQKVLLRFSVIAIQEGILEEELCHPCLLIAAAVNWQCELTDTPEGLGVLIVPDQKGFNLCLHHCPQTKELSCP
jgi:hypothetical protein